MSLIVIIASSWTEVINMNIFLLVVKDSTRKQLKDRWNCHKLVGEVQSSGGQKEHMVFSVEQELGV